MGGVVTSPGNETVNAKLLARSDTVSVNTHNVGDTEVREVDSLPAGETLNSDASSAATSLENVAVMVAVAPAKLDPDAPMEEDNVTVGGEYVTVNGEPD